MHAPAGRFSQRATIALHDQRLQAALHHASGGLVARRAAQVAALPEYEALRERAREVKEHVLARLDSYLERYEAEVTRRGGHVHWAATAEEAREIILGICKRVDAKTVTKGKSMVSEEIALNHALEAQGCKVVETDLGEYIIQLAHEPPSHIIMPAVHMTRAQVADLFDAAHRPLGYTRHLTEVGEMVNEARQVLRRHYFEADVGITGGNFLVAETGSSIIVTNEGNGDLTQTLARVHIVTSGIERVVPTLDDATTFLRLLARSATGQETETYTTVSTGPRRIDGENSDHDGPQEYHVVLVDNGRSAMLGGPFREMLRCIRCGACLNHCPVYTAVGGHAYGWVYPGPMGAVLTPLINGIEKSYDLPNACTLNGRCQTVCPVKIPLPGLLREIRRRQFEGGLTHWPVRMALRAWAWLARRPALYQALTGMALPLMHRLGRRRGALAWLPLATGWTGTRDLPAPQGQTFQQAWKQQRGSRS
ncbi:MAG: iron-sulfur cluster-binding protein [Leptothrix sp. (in: Bacteria)]|nr:iron-sulfur cluster-binding protein [Leptothrix sp. (in: b-proteobacteria)]